MATYTLTGRYDYLTHELGPDEDALSMSRVMAACKANGVWPFAHFNRLQVTPPCIITADEAREGLDGIDKALAVADKYYEG